jgi:hypothetical protein
LKRKQVQCCPYNDEPNPCLNGQALLTARKA